jgi:hypothetical protein
MKLPRVLCINPWIYDFAAYDHWSKPLGLLYIAAFLRERGIGADADPLLTNNTVTPLLRTPGLTIHRRERAAPHSHTCRFQAHPGVDPCPAPRSRRHSLPHH